MVPPLSETDLTLSTQVGTTVDLFNSLQRIITSSKLEHTQLPRILSKGARNWTWIFVRRIIPLSFCLKGCSNNDNYNGQALARIRALSAINWPYHGTSLNLQGYCRKGNKFSIVDWKRSVVLNWLESYFRFRILALSTTK